MGVLPVGVRLPACSWRAMQQTRSGTSSAPANCSTNPRSRPSTLARASMARKIAAAADDEPSDEVAANGDADGGGDDDLVLDGTIICALTNEAYKDTPDEQTLQSLIEQLLREYEVDPSDMERDVRLSLEQEDPATGKIKAQRRAASLAVYEHGKDHVQQNIIRVAVAASAGTKPARQEGRCGTRRDLERRQ